MRIVDELGPAANHHVGKTTAAGKERETVYILVMKKTELAKVIHEWIADDKVRATSSCTTRRPPKSRWVAIG